MHAPLAIVSLPAQEGPAPHPLEQLREQQAKLQRLNRKLAALQNAEQNTRALRALGCTCAEIVATCGLILHQLREGTYEPFAPGPAA